MNRIQLLIAIAFLLFGLPASAQMTFEYGGQSREYYLDSPAELDSGAPLVFALHGYGGTAWSMRNFSGWSEVAETEGIMVCYPQGSLDYEGSPHWNANFGISATNDHGFLTALAQHLQTTYFLSPECTYACGMSNGGFMSYSLACNNPETFRAVGSVTGSMGEYDFDNCNPDEIVPIIHFHGTTDYVVSYNNGVGGVWGDEGVEEIMDLWTGMMGTTQMAETELPNLEAVDESSVDFFRHYGAPGGQEFHHYRVNGGGHDWFGVWGNQDIQATELLWDFFAAHCSGEFTDVEESMATASALAFWNGEHVGILADCSLTAWDAQGRRIWQQKQAARGSRIDQSQLQGIMVLQAIGTQGQSTILRIH
ncbi:alpha/beta hydrolase-fold protein [Flavobacteriales bacterium]|nr:alpha/beta hydrolase-fold protein [Flavobacteriales bacterium]